MHWYKGILNTHYIFVCVYIRRGLWKLFSIDLETCDEDKLS